jgi:hypothetical protein
MNNQLFPQEENMMNDKLMDLVPYGCFHTICIGDYCGSVGNVGLSILGTMGKQK